MDAYANAEHLGETDAAGKIIVEGQHAPVSYHLTATRDGADAFGVRIELSAPRDWLLDRGFDREATLVRENGEKIRVRFENKLGIEDNISVSLEARDILGSIEALTEKYPELDAIGMTSH
ncbi:MAG: hypothetical protein JWM58_3365 [Rhizobium sp.]|nr:hypothetical protein [Rhizobium sp.]